MNSNQFSREEEIGLPEPSVRTGSQASTVITEAEPSAAGHTPGPWKMCGASRGGCSCGQVWCPDYPVAIVTRGEWGDGLDLKRMVRELWDHLRHKGFGFMAYGVVSKETALANARLVSAAPDLLEALKEVRLAFTLAHIAQGVDPAGSASLQRADAAISKALGGSHAG